MASRDLERSAFRGNISRENKWKQAMANRVSNTAASTLTAEAKMKDVVQQTPLQEMRNEGRLGVARQQGANQLATTRQIGANRMEQIGETGRQNRRIQRQVHKNTLEKGQQDNIYNKESDNRNFITRAMIGGAPMDAKAQNAYNTPGAFDPEIQGIQRPPNQPIAPQQKHISPQFDNDGALRPGTGAWTTAPQGPPPPKDSLKPGQIVDTPQGRMMWNGEEYVLQ